MPEYLTEKIKAAQARAAEFDRRRHCGWNNRERLCEYGEPEFCATDFLEFASLGPHCYGTILELALLWTLRPCKQCGGDTLYKSSYQIGCCSCLGDQDDCTDCQFEGKCRSFAENANLPDAITKWNLQYGDGGEPGRVLVCG